MKKFQKYNILLKYYIFEKTGFNGFNEKTANPD